MKKICLIISVLFIAQISFAQQDSLRLSNAKGGVIYLKTEYIGKSDYENEDHPDLDMTGKGDLRMVSGGFYLPVSTKIKKYNRPTIWAVNMHLAHTSAENTGAAATYTPETMLNARFNVINRRPISEKWSMIASLGGGLFMDHDNLNQIKGDYLMATGKIIFIKHLRPNLDLGGGISINTMFGYPMALPEFYVRWTLQKYNVNVDFGEGIRVSAGVKFSEQIKLSIFGDMGGMMALTEKDNKKVFFTQSYANVGLQPEFTFGKLSIPIMVGITPFRNSYYKERTLKKLFENKGEDYTYPHFEAAFYASAGLNYRF